MNYKDLDRSQKYVDGHLHFMVYKGREIHISDYHGLDGDEFAQSVAKMIEFLKTLEVEGKEILNIVDCTNTNANAEAINNLKKAASIFTKIHVKKTGVIGLTALQKVFIATFRTLGLTTIETFDTREEALDWLVAE